MKNCGIFLCIVILLSAFVEGRRESDSESDELRLGDFAGRKESSLTGLFTRRRRTKMYRAQKYKANTSTLWGDLQDANKFCRKKQNRINLAVETSYFANVPYQDFIDTEGKGVVKNLNKYGWKIVDDITNGDMKKNRIIVAEKNNACLVSFRGTETNAGWTTLLNHALKNLGSIPNLFGASGTGITHMGIYGHAKQATQSKLKSYFKAGGKCAKKKVVITGHSLGGGVAIIFTSFLRTAAMDLAKRPENDLLTFTYGQPRVYFKCASSTHDNPRIHRFDLTKKEKVNSKYTYIPDIVATLKFPGSKFCNPGFQLKYLETGMSKKSDSWPEGGFVSTIKKVIEGEIKPVVQVGLNMHKSAYYYDNLLSKKWSSKCETNYN